MVISCDATVGTTNDIKADVTSFISGLMFGDLVAVHLKFDNKILKYSKYSSDADSLSKSKPLNAFKKPFTNALKKAKTVISHRSDDTNNPDMRMIVRTVIYNPANNNYSMNRVTDLESLKIYIAHNLMSNPQYMFNIHCFPVSQDIKRDQNREKDTCYFNIVINYSTIENEKYTQLQSEVGAYISQNDHENITFYRFDNDKDKNVFVQTQHPQNKDFSYQYAFPFGDTKHVVVIPKPKGINHNVASSPSEIDNNALLSFNHIDVSDLSDSFLKQTFQDKNIDDFTQIQIELPMPPKEGGTKIIKQKLVYNKKQYVVHIDAKTKRKYIRAKNARVYLGSIRGKYRYV